MTPSLPTPRDFPVLLTRRDSRGLGRRASWPSCSVCGLLIEPRNRARHFKACNRRKRLAPALWREWWCDMHNVPADDPRRPSNWPSERVSDRERRLLHPQPKETH